MIVIHNQEPFDHIIVKELLAPSQYQEVVDELIFLRPRMNGPENTGASYNKQNPQDSAKSGVGVFLNSLYSDIKYSSINFHTRKLFGDPLIQEKIKGVSNYYFRHWNPENMQDSIIVQYYDHGDFYKPHVDVSIFSAVTAIYQNPKSFEGGNFRFPEFDYSIEIEDNMTLIFPSVLQHEVEPLYIEKSGQLLGRFSITNFIYQKIK